MGSFNGINSALTALRANRQALELTGQNIANAGVEGYHRQRVELTSLGTNVPSRWAHPVEWGGVTVSSVTRLRDEYLDTRGRTEHERLASVTTSAEVLADVQRVYNEPSSAGLQASLTGLWAGFATVSNDPGDPGARTQLMVRLNATTTALNTAATQLGEQFTDRRAQLSTQVADINTDAASLAELNGTIKRTKAAGIENNELFDQRDKLVQQMVEKTGAQRTVESDGTVTLTLGGSNLVTGTTARALKVVGATDITNATADPVTVSWVDTNTAATVGGKAGALREALVTTIPGELASFDAVAAQLTTQVNTANAAGWTKAGVQGGALLTGTTAKGIAAATTDINAIAASSSQTLALDGGNADKMGRLGVLSGGADQLYRTAVSGIGMRVASAQRSADAQTAITEQVDAARSSVSDVSLDEELSAMLNYQRSYEAAARVMSTIDNMLDTIINRMGA